MWEYKYMCEGSFSNNADVDEIYYYADECLGYGLKFKLNTLIFDWNVLFLLVKKELLYVYWSVEDSNKKNYFILCFFSHF